MGAKQQREVTTTRQKTRTRLRLHNSFSLRIPSEPLPRSRCVVRLQDDPRLSKRPTNTSLRLILSQLELRGVSLFWHAIKMLYFLQPLPCFGSQMHYECDLIIRVRTQLSKIGQTSAGRSLSLRALDSRPARKPTPGLVQFTFPAYGLRRTVPRIAL